MPVKNRQKQREKPGPKEERLIITEDPEDALKRLLKLKKKDAPQESDEADRAPD